MDSTMTAEFEADIIMEVMNLDGWDFTKVAPGVLEFSDYSGTETKRFRLTVEEI
jgi:hypothetical protein